MDRQEYERLIRQLEIDYQRVIYKYAEFKQKREAIEIVWKLAGNESSKQLSSKALPPVLDVSGERVGIAHHRTEEVLVEGKHENSDSELGRGELQSKVRDVIAKLPQQFNLRDIKAGLASLYPEISVREPSVRTTLQRLCKKSLIKLVSQGVGRRPSTYEK